MWPECFPHRTKRSTAATLECFNPLLDFSLQILRYQDCEVCGSGGARCTPGPPLNNLGGPWPPWPPRFRRLCRYTHSHAHLMEPAVLNIGIPPLGTMNRYWYLTFPCGGYCTIASHEVTSRKQRTSRRVTPCVRCNSSQGCSI